MNTRRPATVAVAAILLALISLMNVAFPLIPGVSEGIPAFIIYIVVGLGVIGVVAAYGLWSLRRWGILVSIPVSLLNVLLAAPGIGEAPNFGLFISAVFGVAAAVLVIVLAALPASRRACS